MNSQQTLNMLLPSGVTHQVAPFLGLRSTQIITLTFKVLCKSK